MAYQIPVLTPVLFGITLVSDFLAYSVDVNAVVRLYCCQLLSEDCMRVFDVMWDFMARKNSMANVCFPPKTSYVI